MLPSRGGSEYKITLQSNERTTLCHHTYDTTHQSKLLPFMTELVILLLSSGFELLLPYHVKIAHALKLGCFSYFLTFTFSLAALANLGPATVHKE